MMQDPRRERLRIAIVDGFAGGGEYEDEMVPGRILPGSPQILVDAVREAEAVANVGRRKPVHVDATFHFIEKKPKTLAHLRHVLARRHDWRSEVGCVVFHDGAFEDHLEAIITDIRSRGNE